MHQPRRQRRRRALALAQREPRPSRQRFALPPAARLSPDAAQHGINAAEHEYGGITVAQDGKDEPANEGTAERVNDFETSGSGI
jgi:hypothetical protein